MNSYIALVHFPIKNKSGEEVATSVTNMDIHDIARTARTFGLKKYFVVTPIEAQKQLLGRILGYWNSEAGSDYNSDRHDALGLIEVVTSIGEALERIEMAEGKKAKVVVTAASMPGKTIEAGELISTLEVDNTPMCLLFGTGRGLTASTLESADYRLSSLYGRARDGYNHLSVRSAVAIYCDRLFGLPKPLVPNE